MDQDTDVKSYLQALPLDSSLLVLRPDIKEFFKVEAGIQDTEGLKKHIIQVQEEAYKVFPYPCIRGFRFAMLKIARMPTYPRVFELLKDRPDAIFLDIGCCMGAEVRKIIRDGWPLSQTIATDVEEGFWDLGHKLFRTTQETYPAKFLAGDAFDDAHLCPTAPVPSTPPSVASVNTLTELRGHLSVIYASSLFHLFGEERQFELAKRLAALLDPRPGSIIFGSHSGAPVKGGRHGFYSSMFCHSAESWTELWEEQVFEKGQVKATTILWEVPENAGWNLSNPQDYAGSSKEFPVEKETKSYLLLWSVERL